MIQVIDGCIFKAFDEGEIDVLLHCCNMQNKFGAGIAKDIKERYPKAYDADTKWYQYGKKVPYSVGIIPVKGFVGFIFNLYGQEFYGTYGEFFRKYGRQLDYSRLEYALYSSSEVIPLDNVVGIPYKMGCGLAGGDWGRVLELIETNLKEHQVNIYRK